MTSGPLNQGRQPPALALLRPPGSPSPSSLSHPGLVPLQGAGAAVGYEARCLLHAQPFAVCPSGPVSRVGTEGGGWGDGVGKHPLHLVLWSFPGWPGQGV